MSNIEWQKNILPQNDKEKIKQAGDGNIENHQVRDMVMIYCHILSTDI